MKQARLEIAMAGTDADPAMLVRPSQARADTGRARNPSVQ